MTARQAFLIGWACAETLQRTAKRVMVSDTSLGKEVRTRLISRMDHDRLLQLEEEVQIELVRRHQLKRKEKNGDDT